MQNKVTIKRLELSNKYTGLELDYKELKKIQKENDYWCYDV